MCEIAITQSVYMSKYHSHVQSDITLNTSLTISSMIHANTCNIDYRLEFDMLLVAIFNASSKVTYTYVTVNISVILSISTSYLYSYSF